MAPFEGFVRSAHSAPDRLVKRSPWPLLAVCCTAMFLDITNLSAITIALPSIEKSLGTTPSQLQWVLAGYSLTFGSFLLLGGRSGDLFGHRRVLIFGSTVFAVFTICCAVAPSFISLVIFRALQGIGAAFTIPSAQAHIAVTFTDPKQKAKALGFWGAAGSVGFVAGLILGGVLTSELDWRWIFYISFIPAAIVVVAEFFLLPHRAPTAAQAKRASQLSHVVIEGTKWQRFTAHLRSAIIKFDIIGVFLVVPGLLLLTYALSSGQDDGWGSAQIVAILLVSVFLLFLFILHERVATSPLLVPKLFKSVSFDMTLILAVFTYAIRQGATYFLTLQLQQYGNSPIHTSVLFIPIGVSATVVGMVAGKLVPLMGAKLMFIVGWALSIPGVVLFIFVTPTSNYWAFTFPGMVLYVAGLGLVYITANFVTVSAAEKGDQGAAAGIFNVALQVGGSVIGLTIMTVIAQSINQSVGHANGVNAPYTQVAYSSVYYSCVILSAIGLFLSVVVIKPPESLRGQYWQKRKAAREAQHSQHSPSSSSDSGVAEQALDVEKLDRLEKLDRPEEKRHSHLSVMETVIARPTPVVRANRDSVRTRRLRMSIPSYDLHMMSWLNLDEEEGEDLGPIMSLGRI